MEMYIRFKTLPREMGFGALKLALAELLDGNGWVTGSGQDQEGGYVELELEDERVNPKYAILAVKHFLQEARFSPETQLELSGVPVGIYE